MHNRITSIALIDEENELQGNRKSGFEIVKVQVMDMMDQAMQLSDTNRKLCKQLEVCRIEALRDKQLIRELKQKNAFLQWKADRMEDLERRIGALERPHSIVYHNHDCQNFYGDINESDFHSK